MSRGRVRDRLLSPLRSLLPMSRRASPRSRSPVQRSGTPSNSTAVGPGTPDVTPPVLSTSTASSSGSMVGNSQEAPAPAFTVLDISGGSSARPSTNDQVHGLSQPAATVGPLKPIGRSSPSEKAGKAREATRVAFEGLKTTLRAIKESSDCFVPLKSAVGGFLAVVDAIEVCETSFPAAYDLVLNSA
jgi:hypothetical protein